MGRDDRTGRVQKLRHPAAVVVESVGFQHGNRKGQVFAEQVPALAAYIPQAKIAHAAGDALGPVIQEHVVDAGHGILANAIGGSPHWVRLPFHVPET